MSALQKRKFTFTWCIQNFSMYKQKNGENVQSPVFKVEFLKNSKWSIDICPISQNAGFVTCVLQCMDVGCHTDDIDIGFSFTIFAVDSKKLVTRKVEKHNFRNEECFGFQDLVSRKAIFADKNAYLPNDTLTIKCSMWRVDSVADIRKEEVIQVSEDIVQYSGLRDECAVITRVEVQKKTVSWPIKSFSYVGLNERLTILVPSALQDIPSFSFTFCKSIPDHAIEIKIRGVKTGSSKRTFVKCKASVLFTPESVPCFAEDEHLFKSADDIWKFPSFINIFKLPEKKSEYLNSTNDVLHLRFELAFSQFGRVHHLENYSVCHYGAIVHDFPTIEEFGGLYRNGEMSDVRIRASDREFKAHRIILMARSPVFRAMFDNEMKEKQTGVVDIADVDPDTLDRMLAFMYTNPIGDLQADDAVKLYSAADKYQVLPLKIRCTYVMSNIVSVSNVCEILSLADRHQDQYLHDSAEAFIHANFTEVLKSQQWEALMRNNGTLAAKVMHKMLVN